MVPMERKNVPIGVRELKAHASRILRRVRETREHVPITYRGKVVAHVVASEEYERLKSGRADFWEAYRSFRERSHLDTLDLTLDVEDLRDHSKGRPFRF